MPSALHRSVPLSTIEWGVLLEAGLLVEDQIAIVAKNRILFLICLLARNRRPSLSLQPTLNMRLFIRTSRELKLEHSCQSLGSSSYGEQTTSWLPQPRGCQVNLKRLVLTYTSPNGWSTGCLEGRAWAPCSQGCSVLPAPTVPSSSNLPGVLRTSPFSHALGKGRVWKWDFKVGFCCMVI